MAVMKTSIIFTVAIGTLLATTIIFATLFGVERHKREEAEKEKNQLCLTPYCIRAANYLLESIDETVDPCENFFEFACGTWLKNNRIPDDASSYDTFSVLRTELDNNVVDILSSSLPDDLKTVEAIKNAQILYRSCLNETAIEIEDLGPILSIIENEFAGWPILHGSDWNEQKFNLENLMIRLRDYSQNIILSFSTSTDDRNSSVYYLRIGQSDLALEQKQNYNQTDYTSAYKILIRDIATLLAKSSSINQQDVEEIFQFENELSKFHWTPAEQRARQNETVRTTLEQLDQILPPVNIQDGQSTRSKLNLKSYIRTIYQNAGVTLTENQTVSINELEFLRSAMTLLNSTKPRTIQNYFVWRFILSRTGVLPRRFRNVREQFDRVFRGTAAERPRSVTCANYVNNNMGFAVSKVYIRTYFDESAKKESLEMIENIQNAFLEMLKTSEWMDEGSKAKAMEKALSIDSKIGYPDYLGSSNLTELEITYEQYRFTNSYLTNNLNLSRIKSKENLQLIQKVVDRKSWGSSPPTVVNAFYTPSKNQISFPAGILQTPFFHKDAPKYLNYGGIGVVIGHEITHGFDDNGRQFDKDGNRLTWWTEETTENFNRRKKCIVDQYSNYTVTQINMKVNGNQTQGENIADNGGIKESFYAYRKVAKRKKLLPGLMHYTDEQLFFIWYGRLRCYSQYNDYHSYAYQRWLKANKNVDRKLTGFTEYSAEQMFFMNYAQLWCSKMTDANARSRVLSGVHSPGQFRVIGPTSNFDAFDRAFNCRPGQGNSRAEKCAVW